MVRPLISIVTSIRIGSIVSRIVVVIRLVTAPRPPHTLHGTLA